MGPSAIRAIAMELEMCQLTELPSQLTWGQMGIPTEAVSFCFCYPLLSSSYTIDQSSSDSVKQVEQRRTEIEGECSTCDPFVALLLNGGYIYLNDVYDVVAVNSFYFNEVPHELEHVNSSIFFGDHHALPEKAGQVLFAAGRFLPVTVRWLHELGYAQFAWVGPSEVFDRCVWGEWAQIVSCAIVKRVVCVTITHDTHTTIHHRAS